MNLSHKIAIVTGSTSGIGAAFAKDLINAGATVYGLGRNQDAQTKLQEQLGDAYHPVIADIRDRQSLDAWVTATFTDQHAPDILINNAGLGIFGAIDEISPDDWEMMINTNINGIFYLTRTVVPFMKRKSTHSHIINVASVAGLMGNPNISGYNATKFAVRGMSDALFKELRYDRIKVTCIYPGSISTQFFASEDGLNTHSNMMTVEDISSTVMHILQTADNYLISEVVMRPLNPKKPEES
ncbi:MAG: NAD-binding protein [Bacteroidetes bacterium]|jgi:NADP-dependent 3-hydroxy acid dehydrogenase YdfG|nr:MAG: NAD-binding protein [Bacteroidota bacterium]